MGSSYSVKEKTTLVLPIEAICFLGLPKGVMVPSDQDLLARQILNKLKIQLTVLKLPAPAVIPHQHQSIVIGYELVTVFVDLLVVISPDLAKNIHVLVGLEGKMQISHGI